MSLLLNAGLLLVIRFPILILSLLVLTCSIPKQLQAVTAPKIPTAEKGVLDLRSWDIEQKGTIRLDGEWQFYHDQLVTTSDIKSRNLPGNGFVNLPGSWANHEIEGKPLSGDGAHTFRLTVLLNRQQETLALKLMDINSAYKMYVGGDLIISSGVIGNSKETYVPRVLPQTVHFRPDSEKLEIVLQVANFHDREGGARFSITMGLEEEIRQLKEQATNFEFFLFGAILIMGLYHLGIFLFRNVERSSLYFSLFCLTMALRTLLTGERYLTHTFPALDWSFLVKTEQLTFFLVVPLFAMFTQSVFSTIFSSRITRLLQMAGIFASISLVFFTVKTTTSVVLVYELLTIILLLYVIYVIIRALRQNQEGTFVFLLGFIILAATAVNDILFDRQILFTGFWVPFGVLGMICSQAFFLSGRFSRAFTRQEFLSIQLTEKSEELTKKNIELTQHENVLKLKVAERTKSIRQLLDNTGQGFLTFNSHYQIEPVYSKTCDAFFHSSIENQNIFDLLFIHLEKKQYSLLREMLDLIFQGISNLQDLEELLPTEIEFDNRNLKIEFRFIEASEKNEQEKIMVILTDITLETMLEKQLELDEERKEKIYKIAADKSGFITMVRNLREDFQALHQTLNTNPSKIDLTKLMMMLHTIKGNSHIYHLDLITRNSHSLESQIEEIQKKNRALEQHEKEKIEESISKLEASLDESLNELAEIIPSEELLTDERYFKIAESKIETLKAELKQVIKQDKLPNLEEKFNRFRKQPISAAFRTLANSANKLGSRLSKTVNLEFKGLMVEISYGRYQNLFEELIHIIRNSIDHGFESADIRAMKGKPDHGRLVFSASSKNGFTTISIEDDGNGIDIKDVKSKVIERNLATEQDLKALSNQEIIQYIFQPGFTTLDEATQISGRGFGLAAVQEAVTQLGGNIKVNSEPGKGTVFELNIPDPD